MSYGRAQVKSNRLQYAILVAGIICPMQCCCFFVPLYSHWWIHQDCLKGKVSYISTSTTFVIYYMHYNIHNLSKNYEVYINVFHITF